jgi:hypothetical protein
MLYWNSVSKYKVKNSQKKQLKNLHKALCSKAKPAGFLSVN